MHVIFSLPNCPRCEMLKKKLKEKNIPFRENTYAEAVKLDGEDYFWPLLVVDENSLLEEDTVEYLDFIAATSYLKALE